MKNEVWNPYSEFWFLEVSNLSRVRTLNRVVLSGGYKQFVKGRILKQHDNGRGYLFVSFRVNGKTVNIYVHRLVAETFIPNHDNLPEINHIDCDPTNNCVDNLEWVSHQDNIAYRDKLGHTAKHNKPNKPVIAVNLKTLEVLRFKSQVEAGHELRVDYRNINAVIKGKRKTAGGYWFTKADENALETTKNKFGNEAADKVEKLMEKTQITQK